MEIFWYVMFCTIILIFTGSVGIVGYLLCKERIRFITAVYIGVLILLAFSFSMQLVVPYIS
jgi:hypothetical protein